MGLLLITATGICSMMGASINVIPFMIQKNIPGIGPYVVPAFLFAAIPAVFAAFAYAILSSAMPRAGGSYLYASRGLSPYLGFIASFSQWFGLSIVIGVISYIIVPFIRDIFFNLEFYNISNFLEVGSIRLIISLLFIWLFVYVNIIGGKLYNGRYDLKDTHEALGAAVNIGYFTTASLSLFAPPKALDERKGYSSIKLHKWLAVVHMSAMIATNVLAGMTEDNPNLKKYHRAAAYTAFGAFAASMIVIKF